MNNLLDSPTVINPVKLQEQMRAGNDKVTNWIQFNWKNGFGEPWITGGYMVAKVFGCEYGDIDIYIYHELEIFTGKKKDINEPFSSIFFDKENKDKFQLSFNSLYGHLFYSWKLLSGEEYHACSFAVIEGETAIGKVNFIFTDMPIKEIRFDIDCCAIFYNASNGDLIGRGLDSFLVSNTFIDSRINGGIGIGAVSGLRQQKRFIKYVKRGLLVDRRVLVKHIEMYSNEEDFWNPGSVIDTEFCGLVLEHLGYVGQEKRNSFMKHFGTIALAKARMSGLKANYV